jgi:hypothetical protein
MAVSGALNLRPPIATLPPFVAVWVGCLGKTMVQLLDEEEELLLRLDRTEHTLPTSLSALKMWRADFSAGNGWARYGRFEKSA